MQISVACLLRASQITFRVGLLRQHSFDLLAIDIVHFFSHVFYFKCFFNMQTAKFSIEKLQLQSFVNELNNKQSLDFRGGYLSQVRADCNSDNEPSACSLEGCDPIDTVNTGSCHTFAEAGCTTSEPGCY